MFPHVVTSTGAEDGVTVAKSTTAAYPDATASTANSRITPGLSGELVLNAVRAPSPSLL